MDARKTAGCAVRRTHHFRITVGLRATGQRVLGRFVLACGCLGAILLVAGHGRAQDDGSVPPKTLEDRVDKLEKQNEKLEKQNEKLLEALKGKDKPADKAATAKDDEKKADDEDGWAEVGKKLGLKGSFVNYQPWFETEDGAFRFHIGGRTQVDAILTQTSNRVEFGKGGIGKFPDAVNFRRAGLEMEGWYYEVIDFKCEYDFVQTVNVDPLLSPTPSNVTNIPSPTDLWASVNHLPYIGTIRVGNQKNPIGLDHLISSRFLDFMERASYFDTYFNRNNGFEPGIQLLNQTENERMTWQLGLFKNTQTIQGWSQDNGGLEVNGRITGLPWYRDDGRYMIHLGLGVQYDAPEQGTAILRDRWLLRNGPPTLQNTVALAGIQGHHQMMAVPEFFMNIGSLSIQAEYLAHYIDDITSFTTQTQGLVHVAGGRKSFFSESAYVQLLYFLTGEYRPYARSILHSNGAAPTRVVPLRNFFWVPGCHCGNPFSYGAWQIGVRYSYTDLSSHGIYGGVVHEVTAGLNWFLNPNMKVQWNYDVGYRGDLGPGNTSNGTFQGVGTRLAFDF